MAATTANGRPRTQRGFTLLALLAALLLLALATQYVTGVLAQQAQREREEQLLQVGAAYARAIASYYYASPGTVPRGPLELEDLLDDARFVSTRRHLRRLYPDPITGTTQWGLERDANGQIRAVYSLSDTLPIRRTAIDLGGVRLPAATRYSDWLFIAQAPAGAAAKPGQTP